MSKVVMLSNEKGGVGKSTLSILAAIHAVSKGNKTLIIDLDPQNNSSSVLLDSAVSDSETSSDNLFSPVADFNIKTGKHNIDVIPATDKITLLPMFLDTDEVANITSIADANELIDHVKELRIFNFYENLNQLKTQYDCIVIDTPPSFLGLPLVAGLCVVDYLYILVNADKFSSDVVDRYLSRISQVQAVNQKLKINGLVINKFNATSTIQPDILKQWQEHYGDLIRAVLPNASWIEHCSQNGLDVNADANNRTRKKVANLVNEFFDSVWEG